ncbi:MAG: hypothetical protein ACOYKQ_09850, partial [Polymorphobacter sp.]
MIITEQSIAASARRRFLIASGGLALLVAGAADAQQAQSAPTQPGAALVDGTEAIVVTGSRIARDGYDAPTPVSVIGAKELKAESPANIADFVNTLPSVRGSSTSSNSSGSLSNGIAGIASINLRAL